MMKKTIGLFVMAGTIALAGGDRSAAVVGKKIIWQSEVQALSDSQKIPKEQALVQLIQEQLLIVEAENQGLTPDNDELEKRFAQVAARYKSREEFLEILRQNNLTEAQYLNFLKDQIAKEKLIRKEIVPKIKITSQEIARTMENLPVEPEALILTLSFDTRQQADEFVRAFAQDARDAKNKMVRTGWIALNPDKLSPEVIEGIKKSGKNNLTDIINLPSGKFLVCWVEDIRENTPEQRFQQASNILYQGKYRSLLQQYIEKLKNKIPITISLQ
jgi:hypothetical protein